MKIEEQDRVLENDKKNMIVSASAGSGKTYVLIKYICRLVIEKRVPIKKLLILTFTKAAATEMKERLVDGLKGSKIDDFVLKQIDDLSVSNISTIHSFCEHCLKKYANILKINENFEIADENLAKKIKISSLKKTIKDFEKTHQDEMTEINFSFRYDNKKLFSSIFEIENMFFAVADKEQFVKKTLKESEKTYFEAEEVIKVYLEKEMQTFEKCLEEGHFHDTAFNVRLFIEELKNLKSLEDKIEKIRGFNFSNLPKKVDLSIEDDLFIQRIKDDLKKLKERIGKISLSNEGIEKQKEGFLGKSLMNLFLSYQKEYQKAKNDLNILDFNDLEQNMLTLSSNEVFKEDFEYVFIDEYQDTNSLQEKIIKKVAKNCNFVAVGDAKQGIYGFRLASSEIFLRDVEEFEKNENSNARFLKYNFRSDKKVLDFVNTVFKDTMTKDLTGLDYFPNSMLENAFEFEDDGEVSVNVDLVPEKERVEKDVEVYSVLEDELYDSTNYVELETVRARIDEILKTKIYDIKKKAFRNVSYGDIAILSRSRNSFFNDLGKFLKQSGIPLVSNSKKYLMDTPELQVLLSLLKVCLHFDDVSLLSVLMSNFGKFNQNEIAKICQEKDKKLTEIVKNNEKFQLFRENLEKFKNNALTFGFKRAFEILFDETNYFQYIYSQYGDELINSINLFLNEIENSGFQFDLPNLISYFENVDIEDSGLGAIEKDAVLLTTIHKTKGLEYPIVILINAGRSLKRADVKGEIRVDKEFGISTKVYDGDLEENSVKIFASDILDAKRRLSEEMMIFYVALTRAKNRLYIIGSNKLTNLKPYSTLKFDSYFDYIFSTLKDDEIEKFLKDGLLKKSRYTFNIISEVENLKIEKNIINYGKIDEKIVKNMQNYLNFKYIYENNENISFKNSVTNLTKKFEGETVFQKNFDYINTNLSAVEIGNAYHLALKIIDFPKINSLDDVKRAIENQILDESRKYIDIKLLYENIMLLKPFSSGEVFKEKEFIMKDKISNLIGENCEDEIMVQGIVDFFAVKDGKATLIDYKYSATKDFDILKNRYKMQLKLYKNAIKEGLGVDVDRIYLLNLRYNDLIEINEI